MKLLDKIQSRLIKRSPELHIGGETHYLPHKQGEKNRLRQNCEWCFTRVNV